MQQEARLDLAKKQEQFNAIAKIAGKLDSSEAYKFAFNTALKAEAIALVNDKGIAFELDDFMESKHRIVEQYKTLSPPLKDENINTSFNPISEANEDLKMLNQALLNDFEINEKSKRNEAYRTEINTLIDNEIPNDKKSIYVEHLSTIETTLSNIADIDSIKKSFNEQNPKFPLFEIDPIAIEDVKRYKENQDPYIAFEIHEKMQKADYLKSIQEIYKSEAHNPHIAENYANNKINLIKEEVNGLSEEQKTEFAERFKNEYPNGFKTTAEKEAERLSEIIKSEKEIQATEETFKQQLAEYLKVEQGNENEQYKRLQYFQQEMNDNPERFEQFSERFFTDGNLRSILPKDVQAKLDKIGNALDSQGKGNKFGAKSFTQSLKSKVLKETQTLANSVKEDHIKLRSKDQLKLYYARQFKKEYGTAEKKFQMKRQLEQRHKIDNPKLSH